MIIMGFYVQNYTFFFSLYLGSLHQGKNILSKRRHHPVTMTDKICWIVWF